MKSNLIRTVTACTLICIPLLTACGSSKDLDTYQENMTAFITETTAIRDNIDAIDTESGDAGSALLVELDKLDEEVLVFTTTFTALPYFFTFLDLPLYFFAGFFFCHFFVMFIYFHTAKSLDNTCIFIIFYQQRSTEPIMEMRI